MIDRKDDPLLRNVSRDEWPSIQSEVLEWWYDVYDKLECTPLWPAGQTPNYHPEYGLREPSIAIRPLPPGRTPKGLVVVSAGGGFMYKSHFEGLNVCKRFEEMGFATAILDYRVHPYTQFDILADVNRAVRILRMKADEYGYDAEKIVLLGFSAGGQVSLLGGTHYDAGNPEAEDPVERYSCRPNAVVSCYSAMSFTEWPKDEPSGFTPEEAAFLSSDRSAHPGMPPVFIWCARLDEMIDCRNSIHLANVLKGLDVPFELHVFDDGFHALATCDETNPLLKEPDEHIGTWIPMCGQWLESKLDF